MKPYSDDILKFEELTGHYILTEKALEANGIYMRARLSRNRTVNVTAVIDRTLRRVSEMIYNYIHAFNIDNRRQDRLISEIPSLRNIIQRAMLSQAEYLLMTGDLSRSVDGAKRALAIDESAKDTLNTVVPELGVPITYSGGL